MKRKTSIMDDLPKYVKDMASPQALTHIKSNPPVFNNMIKSLENRVNDNHLFIQLTKDAKEKNFVLSFQLIDRR